MAQFTKKAITETFIRMLNETPLDKITVKDIVESCGINRNTFYYYYQDIYALLEEILKAETELAVGQIKDYSSWQEGFLTAAKFAIENKKAVYHIYNSINREQLRMYLEGITDNLMKGFVLEQAKDLVVDDKDVNLIASFYKFAIEGLIFDWLGHGMVDNPTEHIRNLGRLFEGNIRASLERAAKK